MSYFTPDQMDELDRIFTELGKQITEVANREFCSEGSSSIEAVAQVGSVIRDFQPKFAWIDDDDYEGN